MVVGGDVPPTGFGTAALNIGYSGRKLNTQCL